MTFKNADECRKHFYEKLCRTENIPIETGFTIEKTRLRRKRQKIELEIEKIVKMYFNN